ncbi:unnamed protein product [Rhizoctonia solani]|uniref:Peptidase S8/S53 domain-containing protein n=1 Tax=Rhizoctonia solani TaxID=456999 RepID=A0A8H3GE60_9AGAM|nr:unnamed protein product [Rhizoctonia solani]
MLIGDWGSSHVCLKSQYDLKNHIDWMQQQRNSSLDSNYVRAVTHEYETVKDYHTKLRGSALYNPASLPEVDCIIQDRRCTLEASRLANINVPGISCRYGAPWGLDRLSTRGRLPANANPLVLNHEYRSQRIPNAANNPVEVHVLDSGVMLDHEQFSNGRAMLGFNFTDGIDGDASGHGTHVAGIIGGRDVGVATNNHLKIISVKVTGGGDELGNVIAGVIWAAARARATGVPSVINMSFSFDPTQIDRVNPLEDAVKDALACGVHVVVAAGNQNKDVRTRTPARIPGTLAVGASTINDERAHFSNYGPRVGIFAPGECIISAEKESRSSLERKSGTSMAAPLVAGTIAYLIQREGNRAPAAMITRLQELAHHGALVGDLPHGTRNLLINNGVL